MMDATTAALEVLAEVEAGLPYERYRALLADLDLPAARVARALSLSARTLGRRRRAGRFGVWESDRIRRLERIWRAALAQFGERGAARGWLETSKQRLGGRAPLDLLATEAGGRVVAALLAELAIDGGR